MKRNLQMLAMAGAIFVLPAVALAQTSTAEKPAATSEDPDAEVIKIYDENTLKPEDITACLQTDQDIVRQEQQLVDYEQTLSDFKADIEKLAADMDRRRKQIDGSDAKAVDVYNKRVDRHRAMIDRYNQKFLPTLAERRGKLNDSIDAYNSGCADKSYFEEDWLASVAELGIDDPRPEAGGGK
jgi:septal ring factor EnvC (AmiA/AmiB activator)